MLRLMGDLLNLIRCFVIGLFRSRDALEAENVTLRHQLNVLHRKAPKRVVFSNFDRFVFPPARLRCSRTSPSCNVTSDGRKIRSMFQLIFESHRSTCGGAVVAFRRDNLCSPMLLPLGRASLIANITVLIEIIGRADAICFTC
jgi:hypothetical protein